MKQIIAIGGGGFGREIKDLKIEKYIVDQCQKENPSIIFKGFYDSPIPYKICRIKGLIEGLIKTK